MRVVIIGLVFVAIILAGGTAYLLRDYLSTQQAEIAAQKPKAPTVKVLVAASNMPVGTVVNESNTEWMDWPKDDVPTGFMVRTDSANPLTEITKDKHHARRGFTKGEPVIMERLYKSDAPGFLRGSLDAGMRAVAVRTSAEEGASGFILPGDRVDLLLTHGLIKSIQNNTATQESADGMIALQHTSETIIEDLRVLAVDQNTNQFEGGAAIAKTILLEVSAKQAEVISAAKAMGTLSLSLRAAEEGDPRAGVHFTTDIEVSPMLSALTGSYNGSSASAPASAPEAPQTFSVYTAPSSNSKKITVYRGGQPGAAQ